MDLSSWLAARPRVVREEGFGPAVSLSVQDVARQLGRLALPYDPRETPVYEREWDALVLLDACRVDALAAVTSEYEFLPDEIPSIRSTASASKDWMRTNFTEAYTDEIRRTAYVTANPFSEGQVDSDAFVDVDEVWTYGWDEGVGTVPARHVTDRAVAAGRSSDCERLLVHYMQPHFPSVPDPIGSGIDIETFGEGWHSVWDRLAAGELSRERAWDSYLANLRYVLNDVVVLLSNLDAERVVISADHGNSFGEWNVYGHPPGCPIGAVRRVPWVETEATDTGEYEPTFERPADVDKATSETVEKRLQNLGYV
ncbi:hypothetical protein [Halarchaeum grantii]|nr:hypothetical protein [Halarchaeum grantii]